MTRKPLLDASQRKTVLGHVKALLRAPMSEEDESPILDSVRAALDRRELLLDAADRFGAPCYVLSERDLVQRAREFQQAFDAAALRTEVFYAYKANDLPYLCRRLHREGLGAEVVSGMELQLALALRCDRILFNGPAKSDEELRLTARHADRVWLHIDHDFELDRIRRLNLKSRCPIRAAVRIDPGPEIGGVWRKFGVSPNEAVKLIRRIVRTPGLAWEGLHGHLSWNTEPTPYRKLIRIFARVLRGLTQPERSRLRSLDLGGGFYPPGDGARLADLPEGRIILAAEKEAGRELTARRVLFEKRAGIEEYARDITDEVRRSILSIPGIAQDIALRFEPGRWLVNHAVGILVSVVTRKRRDIVLVDGGVHLTHDGRMQEEYHSIVNLSRPGRSPRERKCQVFGPMCDPNDRWGETCWGEVPAPGDRLWIANMGAYGSSSAMRFLFPLAPYILLAEDGSMRKLTDRESFRHRYPSEWFKNT
ncbi:MAG: alanine racemase [Planctomycetota bacterium]